MGYNRRQHSDNLLKQEVLDTLNAMYKAVEPVLYSDFNCKFVPIDKKKGLIEVEARFPKLTVLLTKDKKMTSSVMGIMSTITRILCKESLAVIINLDTGFILSFIWASK